MSEHKGEQQRIKLGACTVARRDSYETGVDFQTQLRRLNSEGSWRW